MVKLCYSLCVLNLCLLSCQCMEVITAAVSIGIASYAVWIYSSCKLFECCDHHWMKNDFKGLLHDFHGKLHGQHLASDIVLKALKDHLHNGHPTKALVLSFHGRTGSGKNHVANLIVNNIFKLGMSSDAVQLRHSRKDFPHQHLINKYQRDLERDIRTTVNFCPRAIFIFDEANLIPEGVINTLKKFMDKHGEIDGLDFKKATFLFLSNTGGNEIAEVASTYFEQDKPRQMITMANFHPLVKGGSFKEKGYSLLSDDSGNDLVDFYVPFLPLEEKHVILCIEDNLTDRKCRVNEKFVRGIAYIMEYDNAHVFSLTGCKTVEAKINIMLEDECD